jgi:isorenieratene synthase
MAAWLLIIASALLALWLLPRVLGRVIRWRLGGYRRLANRPDERLPTQLLEPKSVAILGAGIAGLTAASTLAERGYRVCLIEKASYLGGKLGSWQVELEPGRSVRVSHGFHAFFKHYYNLNRFLDTCGAMKGLRSIGDYVILSRDGREQRFAALPKTPVLNLLGMLFRGAFSLQDALRAPGRDCYGIFLEYDRDTTFREFDGLSYADFVKRAQLPPSLELAFGTFARAFFASSDRLSMAELVKAFHFYYLSHDGGLVYDFPSDDYEPWLLAPLRRRLTNLGVDIRLGTTVTQLERTSSGFTVDGEGFDRVILATDAGSAATLMAHSQGFSAETLSAFGSLHAGQRYAVWRIWIDRDLRENIPVFVITEKMRALDSVTAFHRFERSTVDALAGRSEFVLELHSYAVADDLPDDEVKQALLDDLVSYFPELRGLQIRHEAFQLRADFTAFHVGDFAGRPGTDVGTPGLYCAGDWVKLPFPAMLLEAACSSGYLAANAMLDVDGLRGEPIYSVPLRGLMAGLPPPPGRARALADRSAHTDS